MTLNKTLFHKKLLEWYHQNKRALPWRSTKDPYRIWVSEIILQQTRVAQGLPYYERFIKEFPTVQALAQAREQEVLRLWQGLGYYSRARNMHQCAKRVAQEQNGIFPGTYPELLQLKGIGPYTAAAIASIAFNQKAAVVDGNVYRVLARVFGLDADIASTEGKKLFAAKADELIPQENPGDYNQALMEFGATHCLPQNPLCGQCPFSKSCVAKATDRIDLLPVKSKKVKVRRRYLNYFVLSHQKKIAMRLRQGNDIWKGLYDFHLVETTRAEALTKILEKDAFLASLTKQNVTEREKVTRILTHQQLHVRFFEVKLDAAAKPEPDFQFYSRQQVEALPKPIVITRFLEKSYF